MDGLARCAVKEGYLFIQANSNERLRQAGVRVPLNTDPPALLGASLVGKYALCRHGFGLTDEVRLEVARTSIEASFASEDLKVALFQDLEIWRYWIRLKLVEESPTLK